MYVLATPHKAHPLGFKVFGGFTEEGKPRFHEIAIMAFKNLEMNVIATIYFTNEFAAKESIRCNSVIKERTGAEGELFALPLDVLHKLLETWASH
jgi:hypothetical protein